jgi:hypothetical protein
MSRTSIVLIVAKISDVSLYTDLSIRKFYEIAARAQLVSWFDVWLCSSMFSSGIIHQ